jgi:hypothetical protein
MLYIIIQTQNHHVYRILILLKGHINKYNGTLVKEIKKMIYICSGGVRRKYWGAVTVLKKIMGVKNI